MSFWNHYRTFTDEAMLLMNLIPGRVGDPLPPCPEDVHELWRNWITRGWFFGVRLKYKPAVVLGADPGAEIIRAVSDCGADLVVMPTHGRTGLSRLVLGSVAEKVVRECPCPVLTVRGGEEEQEKS